MNDKITLGGYFKQQTDQTKMKQVISFIDWEHI